MQEEVGPSISYPLRPLLPITSCLLAPTNTQHRNQLPAFNTKPWPLHKPRSPRYPPPLEKKK